jgi:NAD(P)-dependent dehydrogenase (short-subunit alcohol dehydrogenase family)
MVGRWDGKVALVTGGAVGIGSAIAKMGAAEGAIVWVLDVDTVNGNALALESDGAIHFLDVDVTDELGVARSINQILAANGRIDVLVNCASRDSSADPVAMTSDEWDTLMALNLKAPWLLSRAVLPGMLARGDGAIVNIGSLHALLTAEGAFPYAATKAGLAGFTRSLALETGPQGVRVNTVTPGWVLSERVERELEHEGSERRAQIEDTQPLRRLGTPEEIAAVVVFIASDEASFVTGANWIVDGGLGARFA